jgi:hypothetical protein
MKVHKQRRWVVISSDGSHFWLGRHSDPSESDLSAATQKLESAGAVAWLAVTDGPYYTSDDGFSVLMVKPLTGAGDWQSAKAAFLSRRSAIVAGWQGSRGGLSG